MPTRNPCTSASIRANLHQNYLAGRGKIELWGPAQRNPDPGFSAPTNSSPALSDAPSGAQFLQPYNRIAKRSYFHEHYAGTRPSGSADSQGAAAGPTRAGRDRTRCEDDSHTQDARL